MAEGPTVDRFGFSLSTFSPSGKVPQLENAFTAVAAGAPSVGILASNGVVIATANERHSSNMEVDSECRVAEISENIGMVYSGIDADYRPLLKQARKYAQIYYLTYKKHMPVDRLAQKMAGLMQEYTQAHGVRPFGVSLLICGWGDGRAFLYKCDPSGASLAWLATAMGKHDAENKAFLLKHYNKDLELRKAVHKAVITLKSSFEGKITAEKIEVGVCDCNGFQRLSTDEIKAYLKKNP